MKERIQKMANVDEELQPKEFSNLILDDTPINQMTAEDKKYLNQFVNLEKLCMNVYGLNTLDNMPEELKVQKVSTIFSQWFTFLLF